MERRVPTRFSNPKVVLGNILVYCVAPEHYDTSILLFESQFSGRVY